MKKKGSIKDKKTSLRGAAKRDAVIASVAKQSQDDVVSPEIASSPFGIPRNDDLRPGNNQKFTFTPSNLKKANAIVAKYPDGRQKSATLPLLDMAQRQNDGWLSVAAIEHVADFLGEPYMRVYEVASFYSMFYLKPVGKHHIQVCGTTPCWLRGAGDILKACEDHIGVKCGSNSEDGKFTISEVECLGACVNAPLVQINDDYYEDLTPDKMRKIIDDLKGR